jgi:hypothetical protein
MEHSPTQQKLREPRRVLQEFNEFHNLLFSFFASRNVLEAHVNVFVFNFFGVGFTDFEDIT